MDSSELLMRAAQGDREAAGALYERLYEELKGRARALMRNRRAGTLQPTILVHEAWLKVSPEGKQWQNRGHFLATASRAMRSVLVDHARAKLSEKRGGGLEPVSLSGLPAPEREPAWRVLSLDAALVELEERDPEAFRVAQLRIYAGLSHAEIAQLLEVTERTIERRWKEAREFLRERV